MASTLFEGMEEVLPDLPEVEEERFAMPPPKEVLDSNSGSNLRRYIVRGMTRDSRHPIYDHGNFYVWHPDACIWRKVRIREVEAALLDWDGEVSVSAGKDKDSDQPKTKALRLSTSATKGAVEATQMATEQPGAFDSAPPGIALADDFLMVDDDQLTQEQLGPEHLQTFAHPFTYNESKSCKTPNFDRFIREQLADDDAFFLQEWLGAAILGIATRYHRIVLLHGPRGCGKSTLIDILTRAFPTGSVTNIPLQKWGDDTYLCHLAGARLNVVAELPDQPIRQLDRLKSIPEGTTLQVRNVYQSAFTFEPKAAHIFACNSIPDMPGFQDAVGDRLAPILMDSRGEGTVRNTGKDDPDLKAKILARELPGIVYWGIEGARRLLERGKLEIPASIQNQLDELARDADALGAWLNDRTDMGRSGNWTLSSDLHADFCKWCETSRHSNLTTTTFGKRMRGRLGKKDVKQSNGVRYRLALLSDF